MVVAVVVVLALVAAGLVFVLVGDDGEEVAAGELFLEPVASVGVDPFTDPVADEPDAALEAFAAGDGDETADAADEVPAVSSLSELSLVSVEGSRPGLYGGSRERASCDVDRLVSFLEGEANRDKAEAFASVLGIDVDEIESFVSDLTPVVLGADTAVTNHGFSEGEATPRRSVLQRGTAVLVDDEGVPRVKCYCGNPLAPPEPLDASEDADLEVRGEAWAAFDPDAVSTVDPADEAMEELVLTDVEGGDMFTRPVGTSGEADRELEPTTTTTTTEPTTTTTTTTPDDGDSLPARLPRTVFAVGPDAIERVDVETGDRTPVPDTEVSEDSISFPVGLDVGPRLELLAIDMCCEPVPGSTFTSSLSDDADGLSHLRSQAIFPAVGPEGRRIAMATPAPSIVVVDLDTGAEHEILGPSAAPEPGEIAWSPDGGRLAFEWGGEHSGVWIVDADATDLEQATELALEPGVVYESPTFRADGMLLVTRSDPPAVRHPDRGEPTGTSKGVLLDPRDGTELAEFDYEGRVLHQDYDPSGTYLAYSLADGSMRWRGAGTSGEILPAGTDLSALAW